MGDGEGHFKGASAEKVDIIWRQRWRVQEFGQKGEGVGPEGPCGAGGR